MPPMAFSNKNDVQAKAAFVVACRSFLGHLILTFHPRAVPNLLTMLHENDCHNIIANPVTELFSRATTRKRHLNYTFREADAPKRPTKKEHWIILCQASIKETKASFTKTQLVLNHQKSLMSSLSAQFA